MKIEWYKKGSSSWGGYLNDVRLASIKDSDVTFGGERFEVCWMTGLDTIRIDYSATLIGAKGLANAGVKQFLSRMVTEAPGEQLAKAKVCSMSMVRIPVKGLRALAGRPGLIFVPITCNKIVTMEAVLDARQITDIFVAPKDAVMQRCQFRRYGYGVQITLPEGLTSEEHVLSGRDALLVGV